MSLPDSDANHIRRYPIYDPRSPHKKPAPAWNEKPVRVVCLNEKWIGHILGVIERLGRSDAWDGTEEEKVEALRQVDEIYAALSRGMSCSGETGSEKEEPDPGDVVGGYQISGGVVVLDGSVEVITHQEAVYASDGETVIGLRLYEGKCCVGEYIWGTPTGETGVDDYTKPGGEDWTDPPISEMPEYTACAKASKLHALMVSVGEHIITEASFASWYLDGYGDLALMYPGIKFSKTSYAATFASAANLKLVGIDGSARESEYYQSVLCRMAMQLSDDYYGLTEDQFNSMRHQWRQTAIDRQQGGDGAAAVLIGEFWQSVLDTIGKNDARIYTTAVPSDGTEDCACPQAVIGYDWIREFDFSVGDYAWSDAGGGASYVIDCCWQGNQVYDSNGTRLHVEDTITNSGQAREGRLLKVELYIYTPLGGGGVWASASLQALTLGLDWDFLTELQATSEQSDETIVWTGDLPYNLAASTQKPRLKFNAHHTDTDPVDMNIKLYKIRLFGTGVSPYAP